VKYPCQCFFFFLNFLKFGVSKGHPKQDLAFIEDNLKNHCPIFSPKKYQSGPPNYKKRVEKLATFLQKPTFPLFFIDDFF
jgi:hypothetical protein